MTRAHSAPGRACCPQETLSKPMGQAGVHIRGCIFLGAIVGTHRGSFCQEGWAAPFPLCSQATQRLIVQCCSSCLQHGLRLAVQVVYTIALSYHNAMLRVDGAVVPKPTRLSASGLCTQRLRLSSSLAQDTSRVQGCQLQQKLQQKTLYDDALS